MVEETGGKRASFRRAVVGKRRERTIALHVDRCDKGEADDAVQRGAPSHPRLPTPSGWCHIGGMLHRLVPRPRALHRALLLLVGGLTVLPLRAQTTLVPADGEWRWRKGTNEASAPDPAAWRRPAFNDSAWSVGNAPFWYGDAHPAPGTLLSDMSGGYTCVFLRRSFLVSNPAAVGALRLAARSDDGYIAWLNGVEVARYNMGEGFIPFNGTAPGWLPEPVPWVTNTLANPAALLVPGENVLAVQAFNVALVNSDFGINVALTADADLVPPALSLVWPSAGLPVRDLTRVEVGFTEPVLGVDAADLLINGQPATNLITIGPEQFVFEFPSPATGAVAVAWAGGHSITDAAGNPFAGGAWNYTLNPAAYFAGVFLSEFLASNSGNASNSLKDELGNAPDWIEIHNSRPEPVDLSQCHLTDNAGNLTKWKFPNGTLIPADGYLVVFASDRNTNVNGQLHTNFRLSASPGFLALTDPAGAILSAFAPTYPAQTADISYGRDRLQPELLGYFTQTTPGAPNATTGAGFGPEVAASRVSGTFVNPFTLALSVPDAANWDIRYLLITTNVPATQPPATNIPTATSPLYTGPLTVTNTVQVRVRAFPKTPGARPGPPASFSYVRLDAAAAAFSSPLPVILVHNLGGGAFPSTKPRQDRDSIVMVFEPINGVTRLTNPPALVARAGVNVRGSSSAGLPQKSYAVETWDEFNDNRDVEFLGLPAESDWVLYGQNVYDPSFLHNPLMHHLGRAAGRYSSRTRFAEVFVNTAGGTVSFSVPAGGDYHGLYTVEEKIKRDDARVDIPKLNPGVTNAALITGGYLLKVDRLDTDEAQFYDATLERNLVYQEPPGLEMITAARAAQSNYLRAYFTGFGAALTGPNYTNPVTGYAAWIDVGSWIDHHLLNTFALNADAFRLSAYLFKDRDRKLELGPLWDFDRSLGTRTADDPRPFNPRAWMGTTPLGGTDYGTDFFNANNVFPNGWFRRLFTAPDFWQAWIDRWTDLRRGPLATNALFAQVDAFAAEIAPVHARQVSRWPTTAPRAGSVTGTGYAHTFPGSFTGEMDFLKRWLGDRVNFIDTNFLRAPTLNHPGGIVPPGTVVQLTTGATPGGTVTYYTLDGSDPRLPGGAISPSALSGTGVITVTLTNNARLVARNRNPAHQNLTGSGRPPISSPWSGLTAATFLTQPAALAVTEIMFHPPAGPGASDQNEFEFLELKNTGATALNLAGFQFTRGVTFTFPTNAAALLPPGGYTVVVRNLAAFQTRYPGVTNVVGVFAGALDNAGERLTLEGRFGETVFDFNYRDRWHRAADGAGFSLVPVVEAPPVDDAAAWRASAFPLGSPGQADPVPPARPAIRVNEALAHTDPPQVDSVELFNPLGAPVDLGGWFLTDNRNQPKKYTFPPGTTIPAGGYLVVTEPEFGFGLSALGESIWLFSGDGTNLTGYAHGFSFDASFNGVSFGRHVDSLGREQFVAQTTNTLGAANSGPRVGPVVLSEIMFQPPSHPLYTDTLHEFIEVRNLGNVPVPLHDPAHPTNTWRIEGVDYSFPPGATLASNGYALVVTFDPVADPVAAQAFRSRYLLPLSVPLFGPMNGRLANEGERLTLWRPDAPQTTANPFIGFVPYVLVEDVDYLPSAPWPAGAAGTGWSLQRRVGAAFGNDPANWEAAPPTPGGLNYTAALTDADEDGLPDAWEMQFGLNPNLATGLHGWHGDFDGDGMSNGEEFLAGTAPNDPNSALRLGIVSVTEQDVTLTFGAAAGRSYTVLVKENLAGGWFRLADVPAGGARPVTVVDEAEGAARRFYRLVTPALP